MIALSLTEERASSVNPRLERLQTLPVPEADRAARRRAAAGRPATSSPLYIGEPKHPTPEFIKRALTDNLDGLASYPPTVGGDALRKAIAGWLERRYGLDADRSGHAR